MSRDLGSPQGMHYMRTEYNSVRAHAIRPFRAPEHPSPSATPSPAPSTFDSCILCEPRGTKRADLDMDRHRARETAAGLGSVCGSTLPAPKLPPLFDLPVPFVCFCSPRNVTRALSWSASPLGMRDASRAALTHRRTLAQGLSLARSPCGRANTNSHGSGRESQDGVGLDYNK